MSQCSLEQETFRALLETFRHESKRSDALEKFRQKAWQRYLSLGLPSRQHEAYRYIKLRHLFSQPGHLASECSITPDQIASWIYPECRQSLLVFVNGAYVPELSCLDALPKNVAILPLPAAVQTYSAFLNNHWTRSLQEETDAFAALNGALHQNGAFLYLPPKSLIEAPIQLLHLIDSQDQFQLVMPRLDIYVGSHSDLKLIAVQKNLASSGYFVNQVTELVLDEGARVDYTQILCDEQPHAWHFDALRARLKQNANLKTVCLTEGSMTVRTDYRIALAGENAEARLNGMWMLKDKREAHVHVHMEHQAPHCRSNQLFKGVLADHSRSSFEGKIMVKQAAQKTEAFQLNNNLLLDDNAHADSKPNLEIFADDVKATHGATVGQLDPEQLFYMKARGFSDEQAKNLLVAGFCNQIIDMITLPSLREEMTQKARRHLTKSLG